MCPDDMTPAASGGREMSADDLVGRLYRELLELARARMRHLQPGQTLQPTALVNEVYLRLTSGGDPGWDNEGHFFAAAAHAMRQVLVDQARRRLAAKRGGGARGQPLVDETRLPIELDESVGPDDVLALHEGVSALSALDRRKADVVVMHSFAGLTHQQIASVLGVHVGTIERDWRFARAWLRAHMAGGVDDHG